MREHAARRRLWSRTQPQRLGNTHRLTTCATPPAFERLRQVLRTRTCSAARRSAESNSGVVS